MTPKQTLELLPTRKMVLLRSCTLFILLVLQHCLPTAHAEKVPEHTCFCNPGIPGTPGNNGLPGRDGKEGVAGEKGDRGMMGAQGPPGKFGPAGPAGPAGPVGAPGPVGPAGPKGMMGPVGPSGPKGEKGEHGPAGIMGAQGPPGRFGPAGPAGPVGAPGTVGPTGPKGLMGRVGPHGLKGEKGDRGPAGPLPPINLVKLQSEVQTLKTSFVKTSFAHFTKVGNKYFASNKRLGTFDEAVTLCGFLGMVPALPTNLAENRALSNILSGYEIAWLNANDRKTEGKFVDLQEKQVQFSSWVISQPDNYEGKEHCATIRTDSKWNDVPCEGNYLIVCEI